MKLIDKETRYVNRSTMIVRPREPFLRWIVEAEPKASEGLIELVRDEATTYLVPVIELEVTHEVIVREYWREVFEQELFGTSRDEDRWPKNRTREMFEEWFEVKLSDTVIDLAPGRIKASA